MNSRRRRIAAFALSFAVALGLALPAASPASAAAPPYGANNWSCKPSAAHPTPVVLVHGTYSNRKQLWDLMSWALTVSGYCVYALDYGNYGTAPVEQSAQQLSSFVNNVLAATGASKVSLVGHSQGGMMPRYYIKNLGGAAKVDDLIALAPSNHGTTWTQVAYLWPGVTCWACFQQFAGSDFLNALNAGDEAPGGVSYTNIVTKYDQVVRPYTSSFLAGSNVSNLTLQDYCPADKVDHVYITQDVPVLWLTLDALSHEGPASPTYRPRCSW